MSKIRTNRRTFLKASAQTAAAAVLGQSVLEVLASETSPADLVFRNGPVITVSDKFGVSDAVAVRGTSILAVGSDKEITRHIGARTKVVDLKGRSVTPGLIDAHSHQTVAAGMLR